jgi:hypothetical protein
VSFSISSAVSLALQSLRRYELAFLSRNNSIPRSFLIIEREDFNGSKVHGRRHTMKALPAGMMTGLMS